uniref:FN3con-a-lys n=1 Tax=synthetic construct TaxID=32630 RepID=UPI0008235806|nr:Chain A, FN3con-a-lys [synthetic construct]5J7K_B Chain B, FN3con-a-lys [synthetic construct]5J7K_C Chain C, FN3con-a-lys [synthetic construct]5J7K_D Chain D, FN3con-a-lys [synthetic construct]5J7K_E Chain E, FN3con-a-lys [synthetic construct]5J7K_F Chain F, FN3con-a-lys [synthetic construct]5J7K_G Chain G, FN3con-a-lys [synthetic construct]5J7K_H Chain H, FN3con-a-lys [synthetic construct]
MPSPPGNLRVTDVTSTSVTLSWRGYPWATGYRVEYREAGGEWKEVTVPGDLSHRYTVTGLKPGTEYEFRVRAVNRVGRTFDTPGPSSVSVTTGHHHHHH